MMLTKVPKRFLRIAVPPLPPMAINQTFIGNATDPGIAVELTRILCRVLNFNCTFFIRSLEFGFCGEDGCSGMLGELLEGHFDTSVPIFTPTPGRAKHVRFTHPFLFVQMGFLSRSPEPSYFPDYVNTLIPIQWDILLMLIMTVITLSSFLTFYQWTYSYKRVKRRVSLVLNHSLHILGGVAVQQSSLVYSSKSAMQLLLATWALAAVVLSGIYSAYVLQHMLSISVTMPFNSVQTLAACIESGECRFASFADETWFLGAVQTATPAQPEFYAMKKALQKSPTIILPDLNIDILLQPGPYIVLYEPVTTILYQIGNNCSFWYQRDQFFEREAFPFSKSHPAFEDFELAREALLENGVVHKLMSKYDSGRLCEDIVKHAGVSAIPIEPTLGALFLLFLGFLIGACALACEKYSLQRKRKYFLS